MFNRVENYALNNNVMHMLICKKKPKRCMNDVVKPSSSNYHSAIIVKKLSEFIE